MFNHCRSSRHQYNTRVNYHNHNTVLFVRNIHNGFQCSGGRWECSQKACPGLCSAWGEGHYRWDTFFLLHQLALKIIFVILVEHEEDGLVMCTARLLNFFDPLFHNLLVWIAHLRFLFDTGADYKCIGFRVLHVPIPLIIWVASRVKKFQINSLAMHIFFAFPSIKNASRGNSCSRVWIT